MKMTAKSEQLCEYLCRTCKHQLTEPSSKDSTYKPEQQWQSIFSQVEESGTLLIAEVLSSSVPQIQVQLSDELPKKICCECLKQLLSVYRFQQLCLQTDQELRELIGKSNTVLSTSTTEGTVANEIIKKEPSAEEFITPAKEQIIEIDCEKVHALEAEISDADPLKTISKGNENKRSIKVDARVYTEDETMNDDHNVEYSDNETLVSTVSGKNEAIIELEQVNLASDSHICHICNRSFKKSRFLKIHLKYHRKNFEMMNPEKTDDALKCNICSRSFNKQKSLDKHRLVHDKKTDKVQSHPCDLCQKMYSSSLTLERHKRLRHSTVSTTMRSKSRKDSNLNSSKNNHSESNLRERHAAEKPEKSLKSFVCTFCNKVLETSLALNRHKRRHTNERVLCPECGKSFSSEGNLKNHLLRHGEDKPYECPHCPRKFPCVSDLLNHRRIHEIKRHICNICGNAFTQPYELKNHKKIHSGERPHKCDYCEKTFIRLDHQRRHMLTHTGEKPYKCNYCERAFAQSNDHVKHLRTHLGDNIYRCDLCPLAFRLASLKRIHFATHKNDDEETRERNLKALKEEEAQVKLLTRS